MSGRRGNNDPFSQFGFGGFGGSQSLASGFFGGRDPFDDPFFSRPFGGMLGSNLFELTRGPVMNMDPFDTSMGGHIMHGPIMNEHPSHFSQQEAPGAYRRTKGPVIEELNSDDEKVEEDKEEKHVPKKHGRSIEGPSVETEERHRKHMVSLNDFNNVNNARSKARAQSFTFQSSSVTYGGSDGSYYTKSRNMRTGSDGLTIDETKEADSATGRAAHRLARGIYDKGHTVSRNLHSDGRVDTKQILHNISEDDLVGFEEAWKENTGKQMPGWSEALPVQSGSGSGAQHSRQGWALPAAEGDAAGSSHIQHTGRVKTKEAKRTARQRSGGSQRK